MATIQDSIRLMKRAILTNLYIERGLGITPLLSGTHGIGKSFICKSVGDALNGFTVTLEASAEKEGEITGIPFPTDITLADNTTRKILKFAPHYITSGIQNLEQSYYETAITTGFLNGTVKLLEDGRTSYIENGEEKFIQPKRKQEKIFYGAENNYEFGEELPGDIKLKLIESGEIAPVVFFIDELNRTDSQTIKELMNIILNKTINGYQLPWWVFVVSAINPCTQDSRYATNEFDDAQIDRFLKIIVTARSDEWSEYALNKGIDPRYILAATISDDNFAPTGKGFEDNYDDLKPTPRSHEMCACIYQYADNINNSSFFSKEEVAKSSDDIRSLFVGKLGKASGSVVFNNLRNSEWYIDPKNLIDGRAKTIDTKLSEKIKRMKPVVQNILISSIINYFAKDAYHYFADKDNKKNAEEAKNAAKVWDNMIAQTTEVVQCLSEPIVLRFAKEAFKTNANLSDVKYAAVNKTKIYKGLCPAFADDIIDQIGAIHAAQEANYLNTKGE